MTVRLTGTFYVFFLTDVNSCVVCGSIPIGPLGTSYITGLGMPLRECLK